MTYPAASGSSDLQKWLWGRDFMRFTLTYDGPLPSKGGPSEKAAIREHFHPQLAKLWRINTTLKTVMRARYWPTGGAWLVGSHIPKICRQCRMRHLIRRISIFVNQFKLEVQNFCLWFAKRSP